MSGYRYDDRPTQVTPETPGRPMQPQMPMSPGFGYPNRFGFWVRPRHPSETKPFYLTSEFVVSLVAVIAIAITAASSNAFGPWRAWILIAGLVAAYTLSRGIAKAGTHSHAPDPRDRIDLPWGGSDDRQESVPPAHQEGPLR